MHSTCSFSSILILFVKMKISLCQLFPRSVHVNYPSTCTHNAHSTHQRGAQYSYELARDRSLLSAQPSVYSDYCSYIHTHMYIRIQTVARSRATRPKAPRRRETHDGALDFRGLAAGVGYPRRRSACADIYKTSSTSARVQRCIQYILYVYSVTHLSLSSWRFFASKLLRAANEAKVYRGRGGYDVEDGTARAL